MKKLLPAFVLCAAFPLSASAEQVTVRDSAPPNSLQTGWFCGIGKGLFQAKGIDIVHEDGNGSSATATLLANKSFDIGWGDTSTMAVGRGKGMKLKSVMVLLRKTQLGVFVPAGAGLKTPKDLEGKTVIYSAASVEAPYMDSFFAADGTERSKVDLVSVDLAAKMSTYASGTGDAVVTTIPYGAPLVAPRTSDTIAFADYGFVLPGYGMYVHEDTLKEKPETIRKVVEVMEQMWTDMSTEKGAEECTDIMIKLRPDAKLNRAQVLEQIKLQVPYFYTKATEGKPIGWQSIDDWRDTVATLERAKVVPAGTKPEDYFTNEFIK